MALNKKLIYLLCLACSYVSAYSKCFSEHIGKQINMISANTQNTQKNSRYVILSPERSFTEQVRTPNTVYEIQHDFDLRERANANCNSKTVNVSSNKYYTESTSVALQSGQGLWVPKGCYVINSAQNKILSISEFYLAKDKESVFIASAKPQVVEYLISGIVTIPDECVLKFEGGKLRNGLIRSVRTQIDAEPVCIFGENMSFAWYWDIPVAYPEWFGVRGDKVSDDGVAIQKCLDAFRCAYLTNHKYYCSSTIRVPLQGRLYGRGMYKTSIRYTKSIDYMCCTPDGIEVNDVSINNLNFGSEDASLTFKYGIYVPRATRSKINDVMVCSAKVGFALDVYYGSQIKNCVANNCETGFYLGVHGGSNTSVDYDNCYANRCSTGHLFRKSYYVTCKNTSADYCNIAYDFIESNVTLISPGVEESTFFMKLTEHKAESTIGNFAHNNIHVINGLCMNLNDNPYGAIYIDTKNRNYDDRNKVVIDGLNLIFADKKAQSNKVVYKSGDTVLHLNNLTSYIQPDTGMTNYYRDGIGVVETVSSLKDWTDRVIGSSIFIKSLNKKATWNGNNWLDDRGSKIF